MNTALKQAIEHWDFVAPVVKAPTNEREYSELVAHLDEILDQGGAQEGHRLAVLADFVGALVEEYEARTLCEPAPASQSGIIKSLMKEHGLKQSELPEIGSQGVVSEVLGGKRELNIRQIKALHQRFGISPNTFFDLPL